MEIEKIFPQTQKRLAEWKADPNVLGVLLVGSKSRSFNDALSDDDLEVLLTDQAYSRLAPTECAEFYFEGEPPGQLIYDTQYTNLTELRRKAGSYHDLDRWPYEQAKILFDRDGRSVAEAVKAAGNMPAEFRYLRLLHSTVDAGIAFRRAEKTAQRGNTAAARQIVARGAKALARLIFGLEGRWVPLDHWLENELRTLLDPSKVAPLLVELLNTGDPNFLKTALAALEDRLFAEGVPRPAGRRDLFFELLHPSRAVERSIHGLY